MIAERSKHAVRKDINQVVQFGAPTEVALAHRVVDRLADRYRVDLAPPKTRETYKSCCHYHDAIHAALAPEAGLSGEGAISALSYARIVAYHAIHREEPHRPDDGYPDSLDALAERIFERLAKEPHLSIWLKA